jgi:hypothetical protein
MADKWTCQIPAYCAERDLPQPECLQCDRPVKECVCVVGAEFEFVSDQGKGE